MSDAMEAVFAEAVKACEKGDAETLGKMLNEHRTLANLADDEGRTLLHFASHYGQLELINILFQNGAPWNAVDTSYRTAGEYARDAGHEAVYQRLLEEGIRVELLFGALERSGQSVSQSSRLVLRPEHEEMKKKAKEGEGQSEPSVKKARTEDIKSDETASSDDSDSKTTSTASNAEYLASSLRYEGDRLMDADNNAVMMNWEGPLMELHAQLLCDEPGRDVMNIGFGLGLIDTAMQQRQPRKHVIVEAHPDVYKHMLATGWDKKPGVEIRFGRWQEVLPELEKEGYKFDGIYMDTFGEFYSDMRDYFAHIPKLLRDNGQMSFFNGLGGTNPFFHDVYCQIVELELLQMGLKTTYVQVAIDSDADGTWDGVKRRYWSLGAYNLPICRFIGAPEIQIQMVGPDGEGEASSSSTSSASAENESKA